jgi:hypothetical protein
MHKTEIAKELERERKNEMRKQARQRRQELSTPTMSELLRREEELAERKARLECARKAVQDTRTQLTAKYEALPEDARFYIACMGRETESMERAIRAHEQVCLTCPPRPDRTPSDGSEETMDDYIRAFVHTYCALETLDCAEVVTVH